ncbi:Zinc finger PHD-finger [Penicillium taxi]|uniref:Zinc finger PHD-finger n=1 Tax=Penicillium taxi TaxID=168475 RepID=UPI002544D859|nr:Zinc finger PHD-finger [Penicillium taxi]KAJ5894911.1 Zinc finger PHD-finger [Penicillium taxi]
MFSFNLYPNGEPQTPTRTPNTSSFDSFTTPKLESSFFDPRVTWDTADPYASSPECLRSPQKFGLGTPLNGLRTELDPQLAGDALCKNGRSSDQTDTARRVRPLKPLPDPVENHPRVGSAKSAASMQTPPPTSASRRKISEFDLEKSVGRRATPQTESHLETPSRLLGASPSMFANLRSPDLFQLAALEPTGSPLYPQQRLFWDQDHESNEIPLPGTGSDKDAIDYTSIISAHNSHRDLIPQLPAIDSSMDLPEFDPFRLCATQPIDAAVFPAPFSTSPRRPAIEDPAMFLSSPARRFGGPQMTPELGLFSGKRRQPYHHQVEESKREELRRTHEIGRPLVEPSSLLEDNDDITPRGIRPGLTRSATHTAMYSRGIRKSPSKRLGSPTKALRPAHMTRSSSSSVSSLPARSQSVVLRIGRDGRAKTELQSMLDGPTGLTDPLTGMDLDGSATESECDPAEYSEYPVLPRSHSSFALFDDEGRRSWSDSGSRPLSKGSYTSAVGSSHSGHMSPWQNSSRALNDRFASLGSPEAVKRTPKRHSSLFHSDSSFPRGSVASQLLPGEEEDKGDAQHALRQVLMDRARGPRPSTASSYRGQLTRSSYSSAHLRSSPPRFNSDFDIPSRLSNTSPVTLVDPELTTPHTDRHTNPSNGTRCVCHSIENGGHLMIQW